MGRIKIRLSGHPTDVEAFGNFLRKTSTYVTALKIISIGAIRPMRQSTDVFSYVEVEFDSSAMEDK